jgi:hypothetical protein
VANTAVVGPKVVALSSQALADHVQRAAGLTLPELESLRRTVSIGEWEVGKGPPGATKQSHVVYAIFRGGGGDRNDDHVPGDIRVYAFPKIAATPQGEPVPFFRFIFSRSSNAPPVTDVLSMKAFIEDVGFEFKALVIEGDASDDEEEEEAPETCARCEAELGDNAAYCGTCGEPTRKCGNCGHVPDPPDMFCANCGQSLALRVDSRA